MANNMQARTVLKVTCGERAPVREDCQLDRVALSQQVLLLDLWPLYFHLDIQVGCYLRLTFWLYHDGADVINQDSRTWDAVARLEMLQQIGWCVLQASDL